jgi:VanZ family protein
VTNQRVEERSGHAGRWWLATALWSLLVFATIPFARTLQWTVQGRLGRESFGWIVLGLVAAGVVGALAHLVRRGTLNAARLSWIGGVGAVFVAATLSLHEAPEEALHFVEYGVLGVLAWRALRPSLPDAGAFLGASLVGAIVGTLDEAIQWATPMRYWGLRDVGLNLFAATLVQLALAGGFAPELALRPPSPSSIRRLCGLAALALLVLTASLLNTPPRTAWLADHVPVLEGVRDSVMAEYGHLHVDPELGRFRSRLDAAALHDADESRADEAARILDAYTNGADYPRFLGDHPSGADAFVHEARVHIFRRDRYHRTALEAGAGTPERSSSAAVALGEQRILERYFGSTLRASTHGLTPEERAWLETEAGPGRDYESAVSSDVITRFGEGHVVAGALLGLVGLLVLFLRAR